MFLLNLLHVKNNQMKKFFALSLFSFLLVSCGGSDDDTIDEENLTIDGKSVYAAGYYIDGYPNGIQYATYWVDGKRVVLGQGEITDITVKNGIVYATGTDENWDAVYWVDGVKNTLQGSGTNSHSIFVHGEDIYVAGGFSDGSCYWKNGSKINLTTNADSEAFGIVVNDNGNVISGGYYMNNHHYLIPARWNGTTRKNMTKPNGGDAEIYDVVLKGNTPVFIGMTMRQNNMVGLLPKASYWTGNTRTDCNNGGTWEDNIYGGEGLGGFVHGDDVYVTGNIQHIGTVDSDGNETPDEPGITPHYWINGQIFDLPGGPVFDNYWVGGGRDIVVSDDQIIVGGWASSSNHSQIASIWINGELIYLEDENTYPSIVNSIFIE